MNLIDFLILSLLVTLLIICIRGMIKTIKTFRYQNKGFKELLKIMNDIEKETNRKAAIDKVLHAYYVVNNETGEVLSKPLKLSQQAIDVYQLMIDEKKTSNQRWSYENIHIYAQL